MYNSAYVGGKDRHIIQSPIDVVSAGHIIMDESSAAVSTTRFEGFPDYQLIYIRKGKGHFFFENGEQTVCAGHVVLYFPNEPQIYRYYKEEKAEVYWLHFGGSQVAALMEELDLTDKRVISFSAEQEYPRLVSELIAELHLKKPAFRTACRSYLLMLLTRLSRHQQAIDQSYDTIIDHACLKIATDYAKPLTNEELAGFCNMSISGFAHQFKKKTGVSPREYVLRQRLSAACFLLQNTANSIGNIAKETGFEDTMYFSKFFHHRIGMTPTEYRNNYNQLPQNIK